MNSKYLIAAYGKYQYLCSQKLQETKCCIIICNKDTYLGRREMTCLVVARFLMYHLHLHIFRNILTKTLY